MSNSVDLLTGWNEPTAQSNTAPENAIFPYLAQGFIPQFTSGNGLSCGLNALEISLRAVRQLNGDDPSPPTGYAKWSDYLLAIIHSDRYKQKCEETLLAFNIPGADPFFVEETRKMLFDKNNFNQDTLAKILEVFNEEQNTKYELGIITQGLGGYNLPTRPTLPNSIEGDPGRSVLWIWNNNDEQHLRLQGYDFQVTSHWEGLSPEKPIPSQQTRLQRVEGWGVREKWKRDIQAGVWRVEEDCPGGSNGELKVYRGHFVRKALIKQEDSEVRMSQKPGPDWGYYQLCEKAYEGWIQDEKLEQVVEKANGNLGPLPQTLRNNPAPKASPPKAFPPNIAPKVTPTTKSSDPPIVQATLQQFLIWETADGMPGNSLIRNSRHLYHLHGRHLLINNQRRVTTMSGIETRMAKPPFEVPSKPFGISELPLLGLVDKLLDTDTLQRANICFPNRDNTKMSIEHLKYELKALESNLQPTILPIRQISFGRHLLDRFTQQRYKAQPVLLVHEIDVGATGLHRKAMIKYLDGRGEIVDTSSLSPIPQTTNGPWGIRVGKTKLKELLDRLRLEIEEEVRNRESQENLSKKRGFSFVN